MPGAKRKPEEIRGPSAGIGEATAIRLAEEGFHVVLGARRAEKVEEIAHRCGGTAFPLDVTDGASVDSFASQVPELSVLINNAGLASGMETIRELEEDRV